MAFYCIFNSIDGIANALFDCDVHGIHFKCIIPNSKFFWVGLSSIDSSMLLPSWPWHSLLHIFSNASCRRNDRTHFFMFRSSISSRWRFSPFTSPAPLITWFGTILIVSFVLLWTSNHWSVLSRLLSPIVPRLERILSGMDRKKNSNIEDLECSIRVKNKMRIPEVRLDMYFDKRGKDFR